MLFHFAWAEFLAHFACAELLSHFASAESLSHFAFAELLSHFACAEFLSHLVSAEFLSHFALAELLSHFQQVKHLTAHGIFVSSISGSRTSDPEPLSSLRWRARPLASVSVLGPRLLAVLLSLQPRACSLPS